MIAPIATLAHADPVSDPVSDRVIDGLAAELERSRSLTLPQAGAPYFVGYQLMDAHHVTVEATLGGVTLERDAPDWSIGVTVRVGSPEVDNTNFRHGGDPDGIDSAGLVADDAPDAVRQQVWLATDTQYKDAVENLARKLSARRNQPPRERPPDFVPGEPHTAEAAAVPPPDPGPLRKLAVDLSARFLTHPDIESSSAVISSETGLQVALDTGGTRVASPMSELDVRVIACARSPDGEEMCDHASWVVASADRLPSADAMAADVDRLAARLEAWRLAPREQGEWVGPVVFEGDAAVELVRRLLVPALVGTAPLETASYDFSRIDVAEGGLRLKRRALPPGWTAVDDPGADPALPSSYRFDVEGVPGERVQLVEDGIVRGLLMSRVPGEDLRQSNGHARGSPSSVPRGVPSNLTVVPNKARRERGLVDRALDLARPYDLDHVMVVRRLADPQIGSSAFRGTFGPSTTERTDLPAPVEVVRRYADGHEEVVRGFSFHSVDRRLLRDVAAAGASTTRTVLYGGSGSPTAGSPVTITAPAVLVAEVELVPMEGTAARPPRVPSPLATAAPR